MPQCRLILNATRPPAVPPLASFSPNPAFTLPKMLTPPNGSSSMTSGYSSPAYFELLFELLVPCANAQVQKPKTAHRAAALSGRNASPVIISPPGESRNQHQYLILAEKL